MRSGVIEWGAQSLTLPGQSECGDRHVVVSSDHRALVGVVDGVGHGLDAAAAADKAVNIIQEHGAAESLGALVLRCHAGLRKGRGAVISLATFEGESRLLTWVGIGNVRGELRRSGAELTRKPEALLLRGGVVGRQLPEFRPATVSLARDDMLILATDGIGGDFAQGVRLEWEPQRIADDLIARYSRRTDDALVLVARFVG